MVLRPMILMLCVVMLSLVTMVRVGVLVILIL